ncbi:MAG: lyase family protein, partial [Patescibacteria group bacterium]|nr:lyase family protein [Patescibacteria group bacterium]
MVHPFRQETDLLGPVDVPADALWGAHTQRALENFPLSGRPVHRGLVHAYGAVKLAAARANHELRPWPEATRVALEQACEELMQGRLDDAVVVDA